MGKTMFDKVVLVFGTLFVLVVSINAGTDLAQNKGMEFAFDLLTAMFWVGIMFATIWQKFDALKHQLQVAKHDGAVDALSKVSKMIDEAMTTKKVADDTLAKAMAGTRPDPKLEQGKADFELITSFFKADGHMRPDGITGDLLTMYADKFHAATGRYAKLEREGDQLKIEFSTNPFPMAAPAEQPAAAQPKPKKTAAEKKLAAERNEKRRQARLAKKAAAAGETTTTTTEAPAEGKTLKQKIENAEPVTPPAE